jgi:hypothetical protein
LKVLKFELAERYLEKIKEKETAETVGQACKKNRKAEDNSPADQAGLYKPGFGKNLELSYS